MHTLEGPLDFILISIPFYTAMKILYHVIDYGDTSIPLLCYNYVYFKWI